MMSLFPKTKVQTLPHWMVLATGKLAEPAKERIRAEIEAHYAEAIEAHRENGLSEVNAQAAALAELGDPKAAGRRFCKNHLTEREEQHLKNANKIAGRIFLLVISYFLFGQFVFDQLQRNAFNRYHNVPLGLGLEFVLLVVIPTACLIIARCSKGKPNRHLLQYLPSLYTGIFLDNLLKGYLSNFERWLWMPLILCYFLYNFRIWMKVGRSGMIPDYAPPPNTTEISA